jgi:hypothetical protein
MAKIGEMIESKYLKQSDVDADVIVTVQKVGKANVAPKGEEPELKWLIRFNEFEKPMVLNSTNIKRLAKACNSDDTDEWIGSKSSCMWTPMLSSPAMSLEDFASVRTGRTHSPVRSCRSKQAGSSMTWPTIFRSSHEKRPRALPTG